jgi:glucose/mannose-6-phosphate isomerase
MKNLIDLFPTQLSEALQIAKKSTFSFDKKQYDQVFVSGLGGSGIGASIVQEYVYDKISIPFSVNKTYFIPKSVSANTLFIACSYSGNTEETLAATKDALKRKSKVVCVTSGGELAELAKKNKLDLVLIPGGMPPRACLGYSLVQLLNVLKKAGLLKSKFESEIESAIQLITKEKKKIQTQALKLASGLHGKHIALYGVAGCEGLLVRFRQQINENSKALAWHNVVPEMTHNEIVGWRTPHQDTAVVFCTEQGDYDRNLKRMAILKKVVKNYTSSMYDIVMKGETHWERAFYFIHLTDWVSVYLADAYQQDATEVKVIDHLKGQMSKN